MSKLLYLFAHLLCCVISEQIPPNYIPDAIQLIYTTQEANQQIQYHVNPKALDLISTFLKYDSFEIISTIGQARKGKSYTLSKVIQQMSGSSVVPFKSSNYNTPFTRGIWMYLLVKCSSNQINIAVDTDGATKTYPCTKHNKQYIILDIEGSYTDKDDEALRYATIVTLISSQTFLFLHQKLYKHDIQQIRYIQSFIQQMHHENIDFNINDIHLGAIIREPFDNEFDNVTKAVNNDLSLYLRFFPELDKLKTVQQITHFDDENYHKSIANLTKYISNNARKQSRMRFITTHTRFRYILTEIIAQFNHNPDISSVCIFCIFKSVVQWTPFTEFGQCSKKCDGGIQTRYRGCNTGKIDDCKRYIGGSEIDEAECNTIKCEWLPFGEWSECSRVCKGGKKTRHRECSSGDVSDCIDMFGGNSVDEESCNEEKCEWIVERRSECSVDCGRGEKKVYRYCESGNNDDCEGSNNIIEACHNYAGCVKYAIVFVIVMCICVAGIIQWWQENRELMLGCVGSLVCIVIINLLFYSFI